MAQMTHELKTLPNYFNDVLNKTKTFEVRKNDRAFTLGDILILKEWSQEHGYTGKTIETHITYILSDAKFCKEGFVILGLSDFDYEINFRKKQKGV